MTDDTQPAPLLALAAGLAAGVIAAAAMNGAQRLLKPIAGDGGGGGEPATVKAADDVARTVTGQAVPAPERQTAGNAMHYALGAALGGAYATTAEYAPGVSTGFGALFGAGTMLVLDDGVVPAAGWGAPPWQTPPRVHLYSVASHLVFGVMLEGARRLLLGFARGQG